MAFPQIVCLLAVISAATATSFNVAGYTQRYGDCSGNDIKRITRTTLAVCTAECNKLSNCKTFLFVDSGRNSYCWLKHNTCPRLSYTNVRKYHFYNKVAGYSATKSFNVAGYTQRYGDCSGNDIKRITRTTLAVCTAECNKLSNCKTFLFVDSGRNSYCWLKHNTCPRLSYTNVRKYHFYNKVASYSATKSFNVAGYTQRYGDCSGNDIRQITKTTLAVCTAECNKLSNCKTFLFVDSGSNSYCWLKHNTCPRLTSTNVRKYHFYNKVAGYSATTSFNVAGYTQRYGDCSGNDIRQITKTTLAVCTAECNKLSNCKTFLFVDSGSNSYCWLKHNSCPRLTYTNMRNYHFYNKVAGYSAYHWAPTKGCMKLYKHLHTIGAKQIKKSNGQWTSAECRDFCAARPGCVAVDFTTNGKSCWEHTKKAPRVAIRPTTTSETSQYDKQGSCSGYSAPVTTGPFFGYQWNLLLGASATSTTGLNGLSMYWRNTAIVPGPHGLSAWQFQGTSTSYAKITHNGRLNFGGSSWTIGTFFYQTGSIKNGPIFEWRGNGRNGVHTSFGTHFWIWGGTLFTNLDALTGKSYTWHWKAPTANAWHFVGASYNVDTGAFMMWIDNEVFEKNTGKLNALDQTGDVYIGIRPAQPTFNPLKAKLAGMTVMKGAITKSDIASFKSQIISTAAGGARAPQKKTLLLDMFLVLDASSSTGSSAFNSAKQYVITLLNTYTLGSNSLRIKLLYFNGASSTVITLDNDASVAGYITLLGKLRYGGTTINLSFIVQRLSTYVFSTSASSRFYRPNVARSAFLIGGLSSGTDVETQTEISLYIQNLSTQLRFYYFAIGVTKDTSFWSQNLGSQYIVTSLRTETNYVVNWFVTKQTTLKVTGLGFTKKTQNLQLVLTLDGSRDTGRVAYYKTFNLILTLLRTQTIGGNGLKLYIIVYNGGQANVIRFTSANDVTTNLRTMMGASRTTYRYSGVTSNSITLLTKVSFVIKSFIQQNQPRYVWLLGGIQVTNERQTLDILKTIMVHYKVPLKYYGIGTQVDMKFWQSVLPTQSISTNVNVDVNNVVSLTANAEKEAVNVIKTGPVVKDVVKKAGETTTTPSTTTSTTTTTTTTPTTTTTTPTTTTTTTTPTTTTTTPTTTTTTTTTPTTTTTTTPTTTTTTTTPTTTTTTTTPTTTTTTKKPKRVLKRDVIVVLDSTTASGRVAFNKAKEYILTLLRTYTISRSSMRIYVVISSGTVSVQTFDDESKVDHYVTLISQQTYKGGKQDFVVILEKIEALGDRLKTESGRPRSVILIGGFPVSSDEDIQFTVEIHIRDLVQRIRVNIQYFAIGVETQGKRLYAYHIGNSGAVHGTIDTSDTSVVNSVTVSQGQSDAGPQKPKQNTNMQIVLTLDGSTATGKVAFYKTLHTIFSLLDTNNLGPNALQLFVIYYNGGAPGVIKFKTSADIAVFLKLLVTTKLSIYSGARPNTKAILELVKETVRTEVSRDKPKTVMLMGGMQVTDQEETKKILLTLQSEFKIFVYYFAIGVQQDTAFWTTVLDSQYVKTGGDVSGLVTGDTSFITNFIIKIYRVVQHVHQGPTITTIVKNVGAKVDMGVKEESPLQMKVVNNKYWVPRALNVNSPNVCPGGTTPAQGTWCEISNLDAFVVWAKTIGLTVTRRKVGNAEHISISGIIRRTQTVRQSGTLSIQQGALLPKWMVKDVCPSGTQNQGDSCKITNVNQFMTWLEKYGKEYGITQG